MHIETAGHEILYVDGAPCICPSCHGGSVERETGDCIRKYRFRLCRCHVASGEDKPQTPDPVSQHSAPEPWFIPSLRNLPRGVLFINRSTLRVADGSITVHDGPIPSLLNRTVEPIAAAQVIELVCQTSWGGEHPSFNLSAVMADGREVSLLACGEREDQYAYCLQAGSVSAAPEGGRVRQKQTFMPVTMT